MAYTPHAPGGAVPVSKVQLYIKCAKLLNKDVASKSDPCAVLMLQDKGRWYEFGRTENIKNSLDPHFATNFDVDYYFEEVQNLRFTLYDIDNKTPSLNDDDFLGAMECTLGQVVSGSPYTRPLTLKNGKPAGKGQITILAEELEGVNDILTMNFCAKNLDNKDFLGKSDPYLEFSRQAADGSWMVVHRTEVVKNNLNPNWRPVMIKSQKLCGGNYEKPIKISIWDWDDSDDCDLIGECTATVIQLREAAGQQQEWPCVNPKKKAKKKNYKHSGMIYLISCKVTREYSFLDFIFGGTQINFTVAIDFTASNGDPRTPQSLHFFTSYQPNEYEKAIMAVGAVVQDYDSDKMFPALGFGARVPPNMDVSHEFAINFNGQNPFCTGVQGILEAYKACIQKVQLYGPTNFAPIINHVARFGAAARAEPVAKNYFILLILTDGVISDMDNTRSAIVNASKLPVSIIIVGVGGADFTAMDILDGDDGVLKTRAGERCVRDIVQFVPFRDFANSTPAELAKHVLAEVPKQVTDYYKMVGITPSPRQQVPAVQPGGPSPAMGPPPS